MSVRAHHRSLTLALTAALVAPFALVAAVAAGTVTAAPAAAHGSVTDPPTRNHGCLERWGDDHLNPEMAQLDPMCWGAWQHDPAAMWNWNGLYRENVGGNHEAVIPNGQLCSGGRTQSPRYDYMDTPGEWVAKSVPQQFHLTLTDQAQHGADYLRIYVSKAGFDPTTEALGWDDLDLVQETGSYPAQGTYETDVDLSGRSGRAVLYTIWQASHLDQPYYLCSDITIGGGAEAEPEDTPEGTPMDRGRCGACRPPGPATPTSGGKYRHGRYLRQILSHSPGPRNLLQASRRPATEHTAARPSGRPPREDVLSTVRSALPTAPRPVVAPRMCETGRCPRGCL